jgi:hypothetical protein
MTLHDLECRRGQDHGPRPELDERGDRVISHEQAGGFERLGESAVAAGEIERGALVAAIGHGA